MPDATILPVVKAEFHIVFTAFAVNLMLIGWVSGE